jgi:hypothetical protein
MKNFKSTLLSPTVIRDRFSHRTEPEFLRAFRTIDDVSSSYDALKTLRETPDPTLSREGKALRFQTSYDKALKRVSASAQQTVAELSDLEERIKSDALKAAGLSDWLPEAQAQEIRAALRSMSPADREKVVQEAIAANDSATIRAITQSPTAFLYGGLKTPVNELVEVMLESASPGFKSRLDEVASATDFIAASVKTFATTTSDLRDRFAEELGAEQLAASKAAEAVLSQ